MKIRTLSLALAGTAALALSACGDSSEDDLAEVDPMPTETAASDMDSDPMARDYTLTAEQQARRDTFDQAAFDTEYASLSSGNTGTIDRASMSYADADRNGDGNLSSAEYAYYGSSGLASLSEAQNRRLIDAFYYYDLDGDGYISSSEFDSMGSGSSMNTTAGVEMNSMEGDMDDSDTATDATNTATTNSVNDKRAN